MADTLQILDHPLIQHKLMRIRATDTPPDVFRSLVSQVAGLMVFQISRDLAVREVQIDTPLETTTCSALAGPITVVPILRAGIGMADGITNLMPEARTGHVGLYRDEASLEPVEYYCKLPEDITAGRVFVVDPMLATGGSARAAIDLLKAEGCTDINLVCLVAAPEGAAAMAQAHPDVRVFTAALDRQLNEQGYILPGLGDAGDRIFGTK